MQVFCSSTACWGDKVEQFVLRSKHPSTVLTETHLSLQKLTERATALQAEYDERSSREVSSAADKRALIELGHEKRRVDGEVEKKKKLLAARRDLVLARSSGEFVAACGWVFLTRVCVVRVPSGRVHRGWYGGVVCPRLCCVAGVGVVLTASAPSYAGLGRVCLVLRLGCCVQV